MIFNYWGEVIITHYPPINTLLSTHATEKKSKITKIYNFQIVTRIWRVSRYKKKKLTFFGYNMACTACWIICWAYNQLQISFGTAVIHNLNNICKYSTTLKRITHYKSPPSYLSGKWKQLIYLLDLRLCCILSLATTPDLSLRYIA